MSSWIFADALPLPAAPHLSGIHQPTLVFKTFHNLHIQGGHLNSMDLSGRTSPSSEQEGRLQLTVCHWPFGAELSRVFVQEMHHLWVSSLQMTVEHSDCTVSDRQCISTVKPLPCDFSSSHLTSFSMKIQDVTADF